MSEVICRGDELLELLPQREPILLVDTLYKCDEQGCQTGLHIREDNMFCIEGSLCAEGIIEHMAQSASVHLGYRSIRKGEPVRIGYIGEVRDFRLTADPRAGDTLETFVQVLSEVMGITLISAETFCGEVPVAMCRMKIAV